MRLIDADKLCEDLLDRWSIADTRKEELIRRVMADIVTPIIASQPNIEPQLHWIPCSERLPEDWVPVLVTLKRPERLPAWIKAKPENYFHLVDADVCENGEWSVNKKNVTAWMSLPEPYREEADA